MKKGKSDPAKTTLIIVVGFIVVFLVTRMRWAIFAALGVGIAGSASDYLAVKIDYIWMKLSKLLSLIVPNILLTFFFYFFLFPISLLSKLFSRKDTLMLSHKFTSTFVLRNKKFTKKDFENPW